MNVVELDEYRQEPRHRIDLVLLGLLSSSAVMVVMIVLGCLWMAERWP